MTNADSLHNHSLIFPLLTDVCKAVASISYKQSARHLLHCINCSDMHFKCRGTHISIYFTLFICSLG